MILKQKPLKINENLENQWQSIEIPYFMSVFHDSSAFFYPFHPHLNHGRAGACRPRPDELQVMLGSANRAECRLREPTGHCGREHFAADRRFLVEKLEIW